MKKFITTLFTTLLVLIATLSFGQQKFRAATSIGGASLNRGDTFDYIIYGNGMNNNTTRQLLFDIMYDQVNFELVSVNHTGTGGNGGIGLQYNISGSNTYYAGGGGGGGYNNDPTKAGTGGLGGGANGSTTSTTPAAGTTNTGGGGGGTRDGQGSAGGSGVVILRYPDSWLAAASTTGSPTVTVSGGYRIYKFTASGSITF